MCKVYNQIGSLTTIKSHLSSHDLNEFKSVNELINFQRNYSTYQLQITSEHSIIIQNEKIELQKEIPQLEKFIETCKNQVKQKLVLELDQLMQQLSNIHSSQSNIFQSISNFFKTINIKRKISIIGNRFDTKISNSVEKLSKTLSKKCQRLEYIVSNFDDAVQKSSSLQLKELERKKRIIDDLNTSIYGAIGEKKVAKELEKLPDDYILINDFNCSFHPSLYYSQENAYIKSIQIDHILVSCSGIFIIETKNWSENSLNNLSLRSPIKQIKRTGFAFFKIVSDGITNSLHHHHWGNKKIPIRNIIVLINNKPNEEFQYVKVLILNELRNYIEYFKPCFSEGETEKIANYLLGIQGKQF